MARSNIEALYELKAKVTVLKHAVAPLFDAAGRLHGGRIPSVCANTQEYFRDVSDHLARVNASIDTMRDTISTAMAVNLSMVTIEENEVTKRLAAWAGIFAVITAFAGIWGMNFEFMPELKSPWGYPAAIGLIVDLVRHHVLAVPQVGLAVTRHGDQYPSTGAVAIGNDRCRSGQGPTGVDATMYPTPCVIGALFSSAHAVLGAGRNASALQLPGEGFRSGNPLPSSLALPWRLPKPDAWFKAVQARPGRKMAICAAIQYQTAAALPRRFYCSASKDVRCSTSPAKAPSSPSP